MIHLGQTDLSSQGLIFSIVVILLINLVFFLFLFSLLAHNLTMNGAWHLFLDRVGQSYLWTCQRNPRCRPLGLEFHPVARTTSCPGSRGVIPREQEAALQAFYRRR